MNSLRRQIPLPTRSVLLVRCARRSVVSLLWLVVAGLAGLAQPLAAAIPATWQSRGPGAGGALYSPSINPANNNEYYVGCDMSGLYHTTDFGDSYTTESFLRIQGGHGSAVQFTNNPSVSYCLSYAGDRTAPMKSTDGRQTWTELAGNPLPYDEIYGVWADYENPNRVFVAGYSEIYLSTDGGMSFVQLPVSVVGNDGALIAGVFFDGDKIYLGTSAGLIVSTNGGTSFTNMGTPGIPTTGDEAESIFSFAAAKTGSTTRFFCLTGAAGNVYPGLDVGADYWGFIKGIYSLDNATGDWSMKMTGIDPETAFPMFLAMASNDISTVYAAGGSASGDPVVFKWTASSANWTNTFHCANNANIATGWSGEGGDRGWSYGEIALGFTVARNDSAKVLFTDLGFVHRSSDGGANWRQAYVNPADEHPAGTTAIAKASYHSSGLENTSCWQMVWSDAMNVFAAYSDIKGVRSTDGGVTWSFNYAGHAANTMYRIAKHPTTGVLYAGTSNVHDLYQSTRLADSLLNANDPQGKVLFSADKGAVWQTLHTFGHPVFWVCLDPTAPDRLFASVVHSTAGGVFVSDNIQNGAASTWTKLPNPPRTEGHPACIEVLNDGKVVCTYSGRRTASGFTASSGVFLYSPASGAWADVSDPGMRYWTKDLVVDPADATQNTWYVGVFSGWGGAPNGLGGLYRTVDRGAHWTRINELDRVTSLTFNPGAPDEAWLTTEIEGLWHTTDIHAASPVFTQVSNYPFRQPERVFYNPFNAAELWVMSFGNGMRVGAAGVDPLAGFSLSIASVAGMPGQMDLLFGPIIAGTTYTLEWSADMAAGSWTALSGTVHPDVGNRRTVTDSNASGARKFYRVRVTQP